MSQPPESANTGFTPHPHLPRVHFGDRADSVSPGSLDMDIQSILNELESLAAKEDGSGCIEDELLEFLGGLGDIALDNPEVRIAGQVLLGKVLTGLGEDEQVADMIVRNVQDSVADARGSSGPGSVSRDGVRGLRPAVVASAKDESSAEARLRRAAEVVAIRLLRVVVRMEALELRGLVLSQLSTPGISAQLRLALELTADLLGAERLDAHPDEVVEVFHRYADPIMLSADAELVAYFNALDQWVHVRRRNFRVGESGARRERS